MFRIKPQPALKSYFFGKGFKDLYFMLKDFWSLNRETAKGYWDKAGENWREGGWMLLFTIPYSFASLSLYLFGTLWTFLLSSLHVMVLAVFFLLMYILYMILWVVERIYMLTRGVFTVCPNCHNRSLLPHYLCPNCKVVHTRLVPSSYGIFHRTCMCGNKLPTTFFIRRNQLEDYARCPVEGCGQLLGTKESTPICIPLIGGPSVGKTCYLFAATMGIFNELAPKRHWQVSFLGSYSENLYRKTVEQFQKGIRPDKTMEKTPPAFNMFIQNNRWSVEKLLYLYDAAGEAFGNVENLISHKFYGFLHGFLFIIDPFSIPLLMDQYNEELKLHGEELRPSAMQVEDTFAIVVDNLAKHHKVREGAPIHKPCAVLINKVDAFDLEDRFGERAAHRKMMADSSIGSMGEAQDAVCREFLKEMDMGKFLKKFTSKFPNTRFFSVSALGGSNNGPGQPFRPRRVLEPLDWLLYNIDKDIAKELNQELAEYTAAQETPVKGKVPFKVKGKDKVEAQAPEPSAKKKKSTSKKKKKKW